MTTYHQTAPKVKTVMKMGTKLIKKLLAMNPHEMTTLSADLRKALAGDTNACISASKNLDE